MGISVKITKSNSIKYLLILFLWTGSWTSCKMKDKKAMEQENAKANKAFILEMIGQKKQLSDYPGKASDTMIVYEPSSLPFGGTYKGLKAFEEFYPKVRKFYDFSRFELLNVYADSDKVFALEKAGIAHTADSILLCEEFTFKNGQIIEVRLYLYDFDGKPIHLLIRK